MSLHDPKATSTSPSSASATAPARSSRASPIIRMAAPTSRSGCMHWDLGGYRPTRHPGRRGVGRRPAQGRHATSPRRSSPSRIAPRSSATTSSRPARRSRWAACSTAVAEHMAEWPDDRTFLLADAPRADRRTTSSAGCSETRDRRADELSAGRQPGGDRILRRMRARGGRRLRQQHPGVHRQRRRNGRSASSDAGVPIIGDDIKAQLGATIVHRVLTDLFPSAA